MLICRVGCELCDEAFGTLATSFREIWCSPNDLFPYFHMCESELERELRYVHTTHHGGVGAFVCQGVEALGHQIKVACPSTGWCPKTFLAKLFGIIELRHASHEDVLGILLDKPSDVEDTSGLALEDRCSMFRQPTKRQKVA